MSATCKVTFGKPTQTIINRSIEHTPYISSTVSVVVTFGNTDFFFFFCTVIENILAYQYWPPFLHLKTIERQEEEEETSQSTCGMTNIRKVPRSHEKGFLSFIIETITNKYIPMQTVIKESLVFWTFKYHCHMRFGHRYNIRVVCITQIF